MWKWLFARASSVGDHAMRLHAVAWIVGGIATAAVAAMSYVASWIAPIAQHGWAAVFFAGLKVFRVLTKS